MRRRVLIVDDDRDVCLSLQLLLEDRFDVMTASNGVQALAAVAQQPVDVIVLDLMMPLMDGAAFKSELDRRGQAIPVVVMSARADAREQAAGINAAACFVKPVDPRLLEDALVDLAERNRPGAVADEPPSR